MVKHDYGIKSKPILVRNLQAKTIMECIHYVMVNIIWTLKFELNYLDVDNPWQGLLSATAFATKLTYHTNYKKVLAQLIFGHDMNFSIEHAAN